MPVKGPDRDIPPPGHFRHLTSHSGRGLTALPHPRAGVGGGYLPHVASTLTDPAADSVHRLL
jgi:hypothetical protein